MYGAILGDMIGAPYEFDRSKQNKYFDMFNKYIRYTDDSMMTIAVADAIMTVGIDADEQTMKAQFVRSMQKWGREYPDAGYGGMFYQWLYAPDPEPQGFKRNETEDHGVQLMIDEEVLKGEDLGCHPCVCTSSLKMKTKDVIDKFLPATGHQNDGI